MGQHTALLVCFTLAALATGRRFPTTFFCLLGQHEDPATKEEKIFLGRKGLVSWTAARCVAQLFSGWSNYLSGFTAFGLMGGTRCRRFTLDWLFCLLSPLSRSSLPTLGSWIVTQFQSETGWGGRRAKSLQVKVLILIQLGPFNIWTVQILKKCSWGRSPQVSLCMRLKTSVHRGLCLCLIRDNPVHHSVFWKTKKRPTLLSLLFLYHLFSVRPTNGSHSSGYCMLKLAAFLIGCIPHSLW